MNKWKFADWFYSFIATMNKSKNDEKNKIINYLFLGGIYSSIKFRYFFRLSKSGFQMAAECLQESIVRGLIQNGKKTRVITIPFLSSFPFYYKKPIVPSCDFFIDGKKVGESFGFLNISHLRPSFHLRAFLSICKWHNKNLDKKVLILYSLNPLWYNLALAAKRNYKDIHVCVIIPDLPQYWDGGITSKETVDYLKQHIREFDSFVLLAKDMATDLKIEDKPWLIIEGIFNGNVEEPIEAKGEKRKILYTGGLHARYGIKDLVMSFEYITNPNIELWLLGQGDYVDEIKKRSKQDTRIKYLGFVSHEEAQKLQREASILINPRHSNESFTRYSFPSKTLEYMASGTPVLMTHLSSLPADYNKYLYFIEDESIRGYAKAIEDVCRKSNTELWQKGKDAQIFITTTRNASTQLKKITHFIESQLS